MAKISLLATSSIFVITVSITLFVFNVTNKWDGVWVLAPIILFLVGIAAWYKSIDWAREQDEKTDKQFNDLINEIKGFRQDFIDRK